MITHKRLLSADEKMIVKNDIIHTGICIHHTAGRGNPDKTIMGWEGDSRGRIGTRWVIGGLEGHIDGPTSYDGRIVRALEDNEFGWHTGILGLKGDKDLVGIEVCSAGALKGGKSWFKTTIVPSQISRLDTPFRGSSEYHRYSDASLTSLRAVILHEANRCSIDISEGLVSRIKLMGPHRAFLHMGKLPAGQSPRGIISHTNIRSDKSDMHPQPELIDMLLSL